MNNKFAVKVHNKYLSEAVQKLAFDNGYKWYSTGYNTDNLFLNYKDPVIIFELKIGKVMTSTNDRQFNYPLYSALTDWNKIEQAMKPKEPRVIWINEYSDIGLGARYDTKEQCLNSTFNQTNYIRTIKFKEVIE